MHPLVRASQQRFLRRACRAGAGLVVLDVPLLLETGGDRRVDAVAVVWASPMLQAQRALRRPGMTPARLAAIRAEQLPDRIKRRRADYVIPTGFDGGATGQPCRPHHRRPAAPPTPSLAAPLRPDQGALSAISARLSLPSPSRSKVNQRVPAPEQGRFAAPRLVALKR